MGLTPYEMDNLDSLGVKVPPSATFTALCNGSLREIDELADAIFDKFKESEGLPTAQADEKSAEAFQLARDYLQRLTACDCIECNMKCYAVVQAMLVGFALFAVEMTGGEGPVKA